MRPLTIGIVLILFPACGKVKQAADRTKVMNDLKGLGIAYINFQDSNQKPPKSFQELAAYAQKMGEPLPPGVANLTVTWGAGMASLCKDGASSEVVIAHGQIGDVVSVLYANGSTQSLTKAEFDSAKKAKSITR